MLQNLWLKVSLYITGWKTHVAALAILFVSTYDAIAQYMDWSLIFKNPEHLMFFNMGMALVVMLFRQMANTEREVALKQVEEGAPPDAV